MKYLLISSMLLFTGCFSLGIKGEYKSYQNEFNHMVAKPFKEKERKELESQFKDLKMKVSTSDYSKKEKEKLESGIEYYLMVLEDLKD
ncbi:MAG: hypothetical protein ACRC8M_03985 [Cetobacterium sp.]|uniref:hypothetical protein n=1 Tax=Cetobacterium sp. TaxID=2071632 RepID=UPI003F2C7E01